MRTIFLGLFISSLSLAVEGETQPEVQNLLLTGSIHCHSASAPDLRAQFRMHEGNVRGTIEIPGHPRYFVGGRMMGKLTETLDGQSMRVKTWIEGHAAPELMGASVVYGRFLKAYADSSIFTEGMIGTGTSSTKPLSEDTLECRFNLT